MNQLYEEKAGIISMWKSQAGGTAFFFRTISYIKVRNFYWPLEQTFFIVVRSDIQ